MSTFKDPNSDIPDKDPDQNGPRGLASSIVFGCIGATFALILIIATVVYYRSRNASPNSTTVIDANRHAMECRRPNNTTSKGLERSVIESFRALSWNSSQTHVGDLESQLVKGKEVEAVHPETGNAVDEIFLQIDLGPKMNGMKAEKEEEEDLDQVEIKRQTLKKKLSSRDLHQEFELHDSDVDAGETCAICSEEFQKDDLLRILPCDHQYHLICCDTWLELASFCPLCRRNFGPPEETSIPETSIPEIIVTLPAPPEPAHSSQAVLEARNC